MNYPMLLKDIKERIHQAQIKASLSANVQMLMLYWDIGRMVDRRQQEEGWGAEIIPRLAHDIRNELPEIKGFSQRNIKRMLTFYREYQNFVPQPVAQVNDLLADTIVPQSVAQLGKLNHNVELHRLVLLLPWTHNFLLIEKVKDLPTRVWYMEQTLAQGWGRDTLKAMIDSKTHERQGRAATNFASRLPAPQSALASEALKDPYLFDFLTLEEPFHERELETGLVAHVEKFLLELGAGFAFVGRQYHMEVSDQDFYIDLLFYHLKLRCYVVIELKKGKFKPEYAGKMNFYCSVVDDKLRHVQDNPTIGLILCQHKDKVVAEYSLRDVNKPIGISEFELTRALPDDLKSSLPTVEELEERLEEKV